jgi:hypothetical protein
VTVLTLPQSMQKDRKQKWNKSDSSSDEEMPPLECETSSDEESLQNNDHPKFDEIVPRSCCYCQCHDAFNSTEELINAKCSKCLTSVLGFDLTDEVKPTYVASAFEDCSGFVYQVFGQKIVVTSCSELEQREEIVRIKFTGDLYRFHIPEDLRFADFEKIFKASIVSIFNKEINDLDGYFATRVGMLAEVNWKLFKSAMRPEAEFLVSLHGGSGRPPQRTKGKRKGQKSNKKTQRIERELNKVKQEAKAAKKAATKAVKSEKRSTTGRIPRSYTRGFGTQKVAGAVTKGIAGEEAAIIRSVVTPAEAPPQRYSDGFASEPTAVATPWKRIDAPWPAASAVPAGSPVKPAAGNPVPPVPATPASVPRAALPASDLMAFVFRDPLRFAVVYYPSAPAQTIYRALVDVAASEPTSLFDSPLASEIRLNIAQWNWLSGSDQFKPNGDVLYTGKAPNDNRSFVWLDAGTEIAWGGNGTPGSHYQLHIDYFDGANIIEDFASADVVCAAGGTFGVGGTVGENTGGVDWSAVPAGYYSPWISSATDIATSTTLQFVIAEGQSTFGHQCLPDLEKNVKSVESVRMIGVSGMYSNTEAPLERQGKISAKQMPEGTQWQSFVSQTNSIASLAGSVQVEAQKGLYGFLKPTKELDFTKKAPLFIDNAGNLRGSHYDIVSDSAFLAFRVSITNVDGRDGFWTFGSSLEFTTLDTWRPLDVARIPRAVYSGALEKIRYLQQFHENPSHLSAIWNGIKGVLGGVVKGITTYGPTVMKVAEAAAPFLLG